MGVFKEIPKSDGTTTLFYRLDGDRNTVEAGSTYGLGTIDYEEALNKPSINGVVLAGDKTAEDLGLQRVGEIPEGIVLEENLGSGFEIADDGIISVAGDFENILEVKSGEEIMNAPANYNGTVICSSSYGSAERGNIYVLESGRIVETLISVSESGGIVINTNNSETISPLELNVALGTEVKLKFNYKSLTNGKGVAKLYMNNVLRSTKTITIGENEFDITSYVKNGINVFTVEITDSNNFTVMLDYLVNGVNLTLKSNFNANMVYSDKVEYRYVVVGAGVKTVHFIIDGEEIGTQEVKLTGEEAIYNLSNLKHGVQKLEVYATTTIDDILITSNTLTYKLLFAVDGETTPIVSSTFERTECIEGELLNIDYIIYNPIETITDGYLQINDEEPISIRADRSLHYWGVNDYPVGEVIFKIGCGDTTLEIPMSVSELEIDLEPVTEGLELYLTSANRSNTELEENRPVWTYGDITTTFSDLNWVSNGWIDGSLKLTGIAKAVVNFNIFAEDIRTTGKTIDFEFETHNVSNLDSVLISCWAEGKGVKITSTECIMASEQETIKTRFKENERTRITITIESLNSHRMIKTYIDGVLSGIAQYSDQDNFQHNTPVGITINEGGEEIDIRSIKIYNTALSNRAVLTNYIYDIQDVLEKITKYNVNDIYDAEGGVHWGKVKSRIPIVYITGELPTSKGAPTNVVVEYQNPFTPTDNFKYENCELDIQGTSSVYYPRKNYQIVFPERFSFYNGAIPEYEYTMKADYMETSHAHNTGNAIFVNSLYDEYFPTQAENNGVRNTIYGFPCVMYLRSDEDADYEYIGVYNFNNDKNSPATLGLTTDKAESWEFKNNTSAHCLLRSDDFSVAAKPEDDFVARYPVGHTDYTALKRVVSWIVSTENDLDKFRDEFNQYFNLHYCLIYYVMMDFGLLMDSRAKNMFFDTVDGLIWYPRFYDIDTAYGLNNEGVLDFGYGLEQTDENIYNGRNSLFWNNFQEVFMKDITDTYLSLRMSEKLSYDAALAVFEQHQRSQISEANYNEDAAWKYLTPLYETGDTTYLYVVQGSRIQHFKWWIANRIKYLDSKYEAPDFTKDFITMRLYTKDGNFKITPYIDTYIKCRFGSADVKVRAKSGEEIELNAPEGLEFNDTETIIFGGSNISSLGDLSTKYAGTVDIKAGAKLRELIIGSTAEGYSNPHLKILSLGSNDLLTKINVSNCPNLTGSLDVSGCKKLQEVWAEGTNITGINFVDGGDLTILHLPPTITNLTIKNHINLLDVSPTSFDNLQTLVLKNSRLNATNLFYDNFTSLTRLYCKFDESANVVLNKTIIDTLLTKCGGLDDNGLNTQYPNIQGYLTINYPNTMTAEAIEEMKAQHAQIFPDLTITYGTESVYYQHETGSNRISLKGSSVTYPKVMAVPAREMVATSLGIDQSRITEDTYLLLSDTNTSYSYKSSVERIVIPSGYQYYTLYLSRFPNLTQIIWPKESIKLRSLQIDNDYNSTNAGYGVNIEEIDLSGENFDLSTFSSLYINSDRVKKVRLSGKTLPAFSNLTQTNGTNADGTTKYLYTAFEGMFKNYYTRRGALQEIDLTNLTIPRANYLGAMFYSGYYYNNDRIIGTNAVLDLSGLSAPELLLVNGVLRYHTNGLTTFRFNNVNVPVATQIRFDMYTSSNLTLKRIEMNNLFAPNLKDMSRAFYNWYSLTTIELKNLDTTKVINFSEAFYNCSSLEELDTTSINVSNCTNLSYMFYSCQKLPEIKVELWDLSQATNLSNTFNQCETITQFKFTSDIPNVETLNNTFKDCDHLISVDLDTWIGGKISTLDSMFRNCTLLEEVKWENLNTETVTNMSYLFYGCYMLPELPIIHLNTHNTTSLEYAFAYCKSITSVDISHFDLISMTTMACLVYNDIKLQSLKCNNVNAPALISLYSLAQSCPQLLNVELNNVSAPNLKNLSYLFADDTNLTTVSLSFIEDIHPTNISYMFKNCSALSELIFEGIKTDLVTNMSYAFSGCTALTEAQINNLLDNVLDFSSVTNVSYMLSGTNLTTFDATKLPLEKLTSLEGMFYNCKKLTNFDFNVILQYKNIVNITSVLQNCSNLQSIDFTGADFSHITSSTNAFSGLTNIEEIILDGGNIAQLGGTLLSMVEGTQKLKKFDTSKVSLNGLTFHGYDFYIGSGATALEYLDLSGYAYFSVGYYRYHDIFASSPLKYFHAGKFTLTKYASNSVVPPLSILLDSHRDTIEIVDVSMVDLNDCTNMSWAFANCPKLTEVRGLNKLVTHKITTFEAMFANSSSLTEIDLSGINGTACTNMKSIFSGCSSLKKIDLSNIDTILLTNLQYAFQKTGPIEEIDFTNMTLTKVTNIGYLFDNSAIEDLDLSGFNPTAATTTTHLFNNCQKLRRLNLSGFTFASNQSFQYCFYNCQALEYLDIRNWDISKITTATNANYMFNYVPYDCQIIVMNEACRTWLKGKRSDFTNIKLPSEL